MADATTPGITPFKNACHNIDQLINKA